MLTVVSPAAPPGRRAGFNMVEILISLLIVGIITITLMSFVSDYTQRYRLTQAKSDLQRISQAIQLAENASGEIVRYVSEPGGAVSTMLAPYLVDIPSTDPWGRRYTKNNGEIAKVLDQDMNAQPYIIDEGMGRVICLGPAGDQPPYPRLGQDQIDTDKYLVSQYRLNPSLAYVVQGQLYISSADGSSRTKITTDSFSNVSLSPDGSYFAAIGPGSNRSLVVGAVDEQQKQLRIVVPRSGFFGAVDSDTFPIWYPRGSAVLFISGNDLWRYDLGLDRIVQLTRGGALDGGDVSGQGRFRFNDSKQSIYQFTSNKGTLNGIAIAPDGRIAYNCRAGGTAAGLYVVSASGGDQKMVLRADANSWLPVTWLGTDVLIYMTDPASGQDKFFYRVRQDGTQNLPLHSKPIKGSIFSPTPSPDGSLISFFMSDTTGGVVRTDGSGFIKEIPVSRDLIPWSDSSGAIQKELPPIWRRDGKSLYYSTVGSQIGEIRTLLINAKAGDYQSQSLSHDGFLGFKPAAMSVNRKETFLAAVSAQPPGVFIVPILGPAGARTKADALGLKAGETPVITWLEE